MKIEDFLELMMPDTQKPKISTLIFMDLETTGLPSDVGKKNVHITEISMVAVDRNDFETDSTLRVLNKLSLCIRPRAAIAPSAMYITGLYNDTLQNQGEFDHSVPKVLECFFHRLRPPLCLLAHNGRNFDFPVLQAELKRLNCSLDSDILCADTLEAFRALYSTSTKVNIKNESVMGNIAAKENMQTTESETKFTKNIDAEQETKQSDMGNIAIEENIQTTESETKVTKNIDALQKNKQSTISTISASDEEIENLLTKDIENFKYITEPELTNDVCVEQNSKQLDQIYQTQDFNLQNELILPSQNEHTPKRSDNDFNFIPHKPFGKKRKRKQHDPSYNPKSAQRKKYTSYYAPVKRSLFPGSKASETTAISSSTTLHSHKITQFSLAKLYYHFFGEYPPQSHYAEADCIALSKVCQKINKEFLDWIDDNSSVFCETEAMWE